MKNFHLLNRKRNHSLVIDKIGFIGAGKMAEAIICGLIKSKVVSSEKIIVSDINIERLEHLEKCFNVVTLKSNQEVASICDIVILCIKPQNFSEVLNEVDFSCVKLVISIAAGIKLSYLESKILNKPIARVMPNNPALVQKGISAIAQGMLVQKKDVVKIELIFKSIGEIVFVEEHLMDAITGLSGSGPAFVYLLVEAMVEAGERLGITKSIAEKLANFTVLGSAETLLKTQKPASYLREMVTSPSGTTKAGLNVLEERGFRQSLVDAIVAAANRSKELSDLV